MAIDDLLSRLDGIRETGYGKYIARCPAHDDRSPSLGVTGKDDGRILLHCFAGCETEDVLSAVGLTFGDMYPKRVGAEHSYKPVRKRFDGRQVLEGISHEAIVTCLIAEKYSDILDGEDSDRLLLACSRINAALDSAPPLKTPPELKAIRRAA